MVWIGLSLKGRNWEDHLVSRTRKSVGGEYTRCRNRVVGDRTEGLGEHSNIRCQITRRVLHGYRETDMDRVQHEGDKEGAMGDGMGEAVWATAGPM